MPRSSATAAAIAMTRVSGTPTRTKYAVLRIEVRNSGSDIALA